LSYSERGSSRGEFAEDLIWNETLRRRENARVGRETHIVARAMAVAEPSLRAL
jgi:hypothetical protein